MIVYRDRRETAGGPQRIREIAAQLRRFRSRGSLEHGDVVRLLIDIGEFETAVADALSDEGNPGHPIVHLFRKVSILAGRLLCRSWDGSRSHADRLAGYLERAIDAATALPLPGTLSIRVSEGYAYYGLAPETYVEAARRFFSDAGPVDVACIGIRSIGASLSAVVAAALEEQGCRVESWTVRCEGHPFDRRLPTDSTTAERIRSLRNRHWLIVDEGPGLSGSTFCCVADKLIDLGVPEGRIVFFPAHDPDPARLLSQAARRRWPRQRKYLADFDEVWIQSGRLTDSLPEGRLQDVSAGRWRPLLFHDESAYPAVQPWHERRKYLLYPEHSRPLLLKFAGFGRYGQSVYARATALAQEGFCPPAVGLSNGFLVTQFVPGRPMRPADIDGPFLDFVARYLASLRHVPATAEPIPAGELMQRIEVNVSEGLGPRWLDKLRGMELPASYDDCAAGVTDGRMLLHEWLRTEDGYLKTDAVDHHADHFSPGCRQSAWDVAACLVEWGLSPSMQRCLIERCIAASGDAGLPGRLQFHRVAYLAHRLGYVTMAAQCLGGQSADGKRFEILARDYGRLLKRELAKS